MTISTSSIVSAFGQVFAWFSSFGALGILVFLMISGELSRKLISLATSLLIVGAILWSVLGINPFDFIHFVK